MAKFKTGMYISFYCYKYYLLSANRIFPATKTVLFSPFVTSPMHSYSCCIISNMQSRRLKLKINPQNFEIVSRN